MQKNLTKKSDKGERAEPDHGSAQDPDFIFPVLETARSLRVGREAAAG